MKPKWMFDARLILDEVIDYLRRIMVRAVDEDSAKGIHR
jgi:hypothetical protein